MQEISTLIPAVSCGLMRFYAEMTGYGLSKFALISCFTTRGILSVLGQPPVQFTMGSILVLVNTCILNSCYKFPINQG